MENGAAHDAHEGDHSEGVHSERSEPRGGVGGVSGSEMPRDLSNAWFGVDKPRNLAAGPGADAGSDAGTAAGTAVDGEGRRVLASRDQNREPAPPSSDSDSETEGALKVGRTGQYRCY